MELPAGAKAATDGLDSIMSLAKKLRTDPDTFLDTPSRVAWTFLVDSVHDFEERTGSRPACIYLTKVQQWMVECFAAKHIFPENPQEASLEKSGILLGSRVVLDADRFRLV